MARQIPSEVMAEFSPRAQAIVQMESAPQIQCFLACLALTDWNTGEARVTEDEYVSEYLRFREVSEGIIKMLAEDPDDFLRQHLFVAETAADAAVTLAKRRHPIL